VYTIKAYMKRLLLHIIDKASALKGWHLPLRLLSVWSLPRAASCKTRTR
jgi:hypothetical protein